MELASYISFRSPNRNRNQIGHTGGLTVVDLGIGKALAERMTQDNIFVIVIGRRKERLDAFVEEHGSDKTEASVFDITKMDQISGYVAELTNKHPDLDLVFLNSGVQRPADFSKPDAVDLDAIQEEILTNYTSQVALTKAFLPFLIARGGKGETAGIAYTTSTLGLVPMPHVSNYSATKAAMHSFILAVRAQIKNTGVKVIEVLPPAVQTELHGPDGGHIGMPLKDFTDEVCKSLFLPFWAMLCRVTQCTKICMI